MAKKKLQNDPFGGLDEALQSGSDIRQISTSSKNLRIPRLRHREVDVQSDEVHDGINELARSLERLGQLHPIHVRQIEPDVFEVVAGVRRTYAARKLGWDTIEAKVMPSDDDLQAEMVEIEENLQRSELSTWEKAQHIKRKEAILDELGLRAGRGQRVDDSEPDPVQTTTDLAKSMGVTRRNYQQLRQIGDSVKAGTMRALGDSKFAESTSVLIELARVEDEDLQVAIGSELSHQPEMSVRDAQRYIKNRKKDAKREADEDRAKQAIASDTSGVEFIGDNFEAAMRAFKSGDVDIVATMATANPKKKSLIHDLSIAASRVLTKEGLLIVGLERNMFEEGFSELQRDWKFIDLACIRWGDQDVTPITVWSKSGRKVTMDLYAEQTVRTREQLQEAWERLLRRIIEPGLVVIDPMCGKGSVAIAAWRQGAKAFGMDIDEDKLALARRTVDGIAAKAS